MERSPTEDFAQITRRLRSDTAFAGVAPGERPVLVDFLVRAQEAEGPEQGEIYKHVGDLALFTAGLFSTSLVVDRGYYVSVGQGAYGSAAAWQRPTTAAVLQELSDRLPDVTDALTDAIVKVPSPLA